MIPYTEINPTRHGNMLGLKSDQYITSAMSIYGESAQYEIDACLQFIKQGDIVIDVGANIGTFTIPIARRVGPDGGVVCIEPERHCFACLSANIAINSMIDFVQPMRAAASDSYGLAKIPIINALKSTNTGGTRLNDESVPCDSVEQIAIDSLGLKKIGFIKIDVEGMEWRVLNGAKETINLCRPIVFVECLPDDKENSGNMREFFKANNYEARLLISPLFNPNNCHQVTKNIFGEGMCNFNVIAIPNEAKKPDWYNDIQNIL